MRSHNAAIGAGRRRFADPMSTPGQQHTRHMAIAAAEAAVASPIASVAPPAPSKSAFTVRHVGSNSSHVEPQAPPQAPAPLDRYQQWISLQLLVTESMRNAWRQSKARYALEREARLLTLELRSRQSTDKKAAMRPVQLDEAAEDGHLDMLEFDFQCTWGNLINDVNGALHSIPQHKDASLAPIANALAMLELHQRYSSASFLAPARQQVAKLKAQLQRLDAGADAPTTPTTSQTTRGSAGSVSPQPAHRRSYSQSLPRIESAGSEGGLSDLTESFSLSPTDERSLLRKDEQARPEVTHPSEEDAAAVDPSSVVVHVPLDWNAVLREDVRREVVENRRNVKLSKIAALPLGSCFLESV